jgi:gamma-glutamyltranspeptidase
MTRSGAIATPHHLATEAGQDAFNAGGNAIDAAITAAAALMVVYPNNTALGSDLVALVRRPDGSVHCVNATGYAPAAQSLERLTALYGEAVPARGVDAMTVPGAVRGWESLRTFGGRLDWAAYLTAAIRFAADGVPVARSVAAALGDLVADPGCRDVFFVGGEPLRRGDLLVQPALARSLAELRSQGPDALYGGSLGRRLVAGLVERGSVMSVEDLADYRPEIVEPLRMAFREYEVISSPPNTQGFMLLRALRGIQDLGDPDDILEGGAGKLARIFDRGNLVRGQLLADPRFSSVSVTDLIRGEPEFDQPGPVPASASGDTVGISAIDSDGYAVSLIQSVFQAFGAGVLEPSTGILMQNRGTSFSLDPTSPNAVAPRKRPRHTLMPVLVTERGEVRWVSSTMGGQAQPQIHAQVLLRSLAGAAPAEAVGAARWVVTARQPGEENSKVRLEEDVSPQAGRSLRGEGFAIDPLVPHSERVGHANLVEVDGHGRFRAASDPRSDGSAGLVEVG